MLLHDIKSLSHLFISFLVAAAGLQTLWSIALAITDVYAILVRRSLQNYRLVSSFTIGDGVRSPIRLINIVTIIVTIPFTLKLHNVDIGFLTSIIVIFPFENAIQS